MPVGPHFACRNNQKYTNHKVHKLTGSNCVRNPDTVVKRRGDRIDYYYYYNARSLSIIAKSLIISVFLGF